MRNFSVSCLVIAFLSTSAVAADADGGKPKKDPEKIICKADKTTGSAISERICKKRSEWEDERFRARELMDDRNRVGRQQSTQGSGG
jgi:hypothetical protein